MSVYDQRTGFMKQLSYDETVQLIKGQKGDPSLAPGLARRVVLGVSADRRPHLLPPLLRQAADGEAAVGVVAGRDDCDRADRAGRGAVVRILRRMLFERPSLTDRLDPVKSSDHATIALFADDPRRSRGVDAPT